MRQQHVDEIIEQVQPLLPCQRPTPCICFKLTGRLNTCGLEHCLEWDHIAVVQLGRRNHVILGQLLTVIGIEIPLPTFRLSKGIHEHVVLGPHCPVKILQPVRLFAFEEIGQFCSVGVEMLRVGAFRFCAPRFTFRRQRLQGLVQAVLIRLLPHEAASTHLGS